MENDVVVYRITMVTVFSPVTRPDMDFDTAFCQPAVDSHGGVLEIGPGLTADSAGVQDFQRFAVLRDQYGTDTHQPLPEFDHPFSVIPCISLFLLAHKERRYQH